MSAEAVAVAGAAAPFLGSLAPTNLVVPPHSFPAANALLIGEEGTTSAPSG